MKWVAAFVGVFLIGQGPMVSAEPGRFSFKGFGTAAAVGADTDALGYRTNISQDVGARRSPSFDVDSRLGLQLDADFNDAWHAGIQWVARSHPGDFVEQNLDWAFLRWRPVADVDIRLGRLGFDVFFLSDYRNVGYAYPWIRPPHEFYGGLPTYHFDGADVSKKLAVGEGYLTVKLFGGHSFYQLPTGFGGTMDAASALGGGSLVYEIGNWRARLGYVHTEQLRKVPLQPLLAALNAPAVQAVWPSGALLVENNLAQGKAVQFSSLGLSYDDGVWLAQFEAAYIDSEVASYPSMGNGYISLGRRFGPVTIFTVGGIAESLHSKTNVAQPLLPIPQVLGLRRTVDGFLNDNGVDEKSLSLGGRWDVMENVDLKVQWTHYWLGQNGTQLWQEPTQGSAPREVNVWSVGVDFVF